MESQLTTQELTNHKADEAIIERGLKSFYEVGSALLRIRERKSYRQTHETFEAYCRDRWDMGRNYVNKQVAATTAVNNLGTIVPILPTTESQCRPLTYLTTPEQQQEAWKRALEVAEKQGKKVTAKIVEEAVNNVIQENAPELDIPDGPDVQDSGESTGSEEDGDPLAGLGTEEESAEFYRKAYEHIDDFYESLREFLKSFNGELKVPEELKKSAKRIIEAGFRAESKKSHPDQGGTHEAMVSLNQAKDFLITLVN